MVDMGLIEDVRVEAERVEIDMVLTTGWCPFVAALNSSMMEEVARLPGVEDVEIRVVWEPVWTPERLSPEARARLEMPLEPLLPYRRRRLEAERSEP